MSEAGELMLSSDGASAAEQSTFQRYFLKVALQIYFLPQTNLTRILCLQQQSSGIPHTFER